MLRRFGISIALLFTLLQLFSAPNDAHAGVVLSNLSDARDDSVWFHNATGIRFRVPEGDINYQLESLAIDTTIVYHPTLTPAPYVLTICDGTQWDPTSQCQIISTQQLQQSTHLILVTEQIVALISGQYYWLTVSHPNPAFVWISATASALPIGDFIFLATAHDEPYIGWYEGSLAFELNAVPLTFAVAPVADVLTPPDDRVNWLNGDLEGSLYFRRDDAGNPALHVYCINESSRGYLAMVVTEADLVGYPEQPAENTLVMESEVCPASFYILTTGEYQINIGPNEEGKVYVYIGSGLAMEGMYSYMLDPQTISP